MSIDGEQDIRERLGHVLGTIGTRPAPVRDAMRQGGVIRRRRRISAAGALAAMVAAAVAIPIALHAAGSPRYTPVSPGHHKVTVNPPGPHAPAGLIAWGSLDGRRWAMMASKPRAAHHRRNTQCFTVMGSQNCGPAMTTSGPRPVLLTVLPIASKTAFKHSPTAVYGPVAADVAYLKVRLAGGTVLTLHPVRVYGTRYAAFAADAAAITSITAYSQHKSLGTVIAFRAGRNLYFGNWLRPGERIRLPRITRLIGSGRSAGFTWAVKVYQGPWGRCVLPASSGIWYASDCLQGASPAGVAFAGEPGAVRLVYGTVPADVAHIMITMSNGTSIRVRAVIAGNQKYFAFAFRSGVRPLRWAAYNSAGGVIGAGPMTNLSWPLHP